MKKKKEERRDIYLLTEKREVFLVDLEISSLYLSWFLYMFLTLKEEGVTIWELKDEVPL